MRRVGERVGNGHQLNSRSRSGMGIPVPRVLPVASNAKSHHLHKDLYNENATEDQLRDLHTKGVVAAGPQSTARKGPLRGC